MYNFMLNVTAFIMFILLPMLTIILIVRALKRKPVKQILIAIGISVICFFASTAMTIFNVPEDMVTEKVETTAKVQEPTTEKETDPPTTVPTTEMVDTMVQQFVQLGFTQSEAEEMKEIFTTVGITKISNIEGFGSATIDELKMFKCDIYDYHRDKGGVSVHFTVDKRQLCFVSLDGIPATKTDYAYINIFGNVKFKTSNTSRSVTLYDKWDENGEIDNSAIGYLAVFDYENQKITKYEAQ